MCCPLLLLLLALAVHCSAAVPANCNLFVNGRTGSDANNGSSAASATATIAAASQLAASWNSTTLYTAITICVYGDDTLTYTNDLGHAASMTQNLYAFSYSYVGYPDRVRLHNTTFRFPATVQNFHFAYSTSDVLTQPLLYGWVSYAHDSVWTPALHSTVDNCLFDSAVLEDGTLSNGTEIYPNALIHVHTDLSSATPSARATLTVTNCQFLHCSAPLLMAAHRHVQVRLSNNTIQHSTGIALYALLASDSNNDGALIEQQSVVNHTVGLPVSCLTLFPAALFHVCSPDYALNYTLSLTFLDNTVVNSTFQRYSSVLDSQLYNAAINMTVSGNRFLTNRFNMTSFRMADPPVSIALVSLWDTDLCALSSSMLFRNNTMQCNALLKEPYNTHSVFPLRLPHSYHPLHFQYSDNTVASECPLYCDAPGHDNFPYICGQCGDAAAAYWNTTLRVCMGCPVGAAPNAAGDDCTACSPGFYLSG